MRDTNEDLCTLEHLVASGQIDKLRKKILSLWPPDTFWSREDVETVIMLLRRLRNSYGDKAVPIYLLFAERLKSHNDDLSWLMSLPIRAEIIKTYEGPEQTAEWLKALDHQIVPPHDGVVDLLLGRIFMSENNYSAAREHFRRALLQSLSMNSPEQPEWYLLEALKDMGNCLLWFGENRLAFEYYRTHSIASYQLGGIRREGDMYRAVLSLSQVLGQIDYFVDVLRNLAQKARNKGNYTQAAVHEVDAGITLAQIGIRHEAVPVLLQAAQDADKGSILGDAHYGLSARLLARYLDKKVIGIKELEQVFISASQWFNYFLIELLGYTRIALNDKTAPNAQVLDKWQGAIKTYESVSGGDLGRMFPILIKVAALLGRFFRENQDDATTEFFYEAVTSIQGNQSIILPFAREDYIEHLIRKGKFQKALQVCEPVLRQENTHAHERFVFRQFAAQCSLALGRKKAAYSYAKLALGDWKKVLKGLYSETHKVNWIRYGDSCLSCAIHAIRDPVLWMPDQKRHRELFRLVELGKARLVTDMLCYGNYLPGVYLMSQTKNPFDILKKQHTDDREFFEWCVPAIIQIHSSMDGILTYNYDKNNKMASIHKPDMSALQSVIQLPLSPEKRLYATAESLTFHEPEYSVHGDLYDDLLQIRQILPDDRW